MNHSGLNAGTRVRCLIPIDLWISMESPFTPNGYVTWLLQPTMVFPTTGAKCTILAYQFWHRLSTPLYSENTSVKITMLSTNEKLWYDVIIIRNGSLAIMNTYLKYTGYAQQWFRRWQWKLCWTHICIQHVAKLLLQSPAKLILNGSVTNIK